MTVRRVLLATLGHSVFSPVVEKWHINWNCRQTFLKCTMSFMCRNSDAASRILSEPWIMKCLNCERIFLIKSIRSAFLIKLNVEPVRSQPNSLKFSGRIIPKMKPLGNARIVFAKNTPLSFSLPLNSRDENSCKRRRIVTSPCNHSINPLLAVPCHHVGQCIIIISIQTHFKFKLNLQFKI